ncbi:MAG: agmatinase [Patescibacteria group bacterium]|jgi:agmatinase
MDVKKRVQFNYGGLTDEQAAYPAAKVVIIPVAYDGTASYLKGTAQGPRAIMDASRYMELYDEELNGSVFEQGIHTTETIAGLEQPEDASAQLYLAAKTVLADNKFPVIFGGEHSISVGAVKALKEQYSDLSVLQIDAHSDLREEYEGSRYNHACALARIRDYCPAVQIGIRAQCVEEAEIIKQKKYPVFYAKDIVDNDNWHEVAINKLSKHVYVTIDVDGFDPSIIPATGTPEPGGLLWYPTLKFLRKLFKQKEIVGFDVVELAPHEHSQPSDFLVAKLVYKLLGYKFL